MQNHFFSLADFSSRILLQKWNDLYIAISKALAEPSLGSRMQNVSELLKAARKDVEELLTNIWKYYELNIRQTELFYTPFFCLSLTFSRSLMERLYNCMSYCLVNCLVLYINWWLCFVWLPISDITEMNFADPYEMRLSYLSPHPSFYCRTLLYFFFLWRRRFRSIKNSEILRLSLCVFECLLLML